MFREKSYKIVERQIASPLKDLHYNGPASLPPGPAYRVHGPLGPVEAPPHPGHAGLGGRAPSRHYRGVKAACLTALRTRALG